MEIEFSLEQIHQIAQEVLKQNPEKVILFNGDMGVGKTTFIKALSKALGVKDATSSPTFSLVNEYEAENGKLVYHFDVYRLKNEAEAYDMGIDEYLYSGEWCFIEWAEKIPSLIPQQHSVINIKLLGNGNRKLTLKN
ncbi:tRNA threonylcarbamoyladenosine biosynthesis protein TsaE [Flavobacterium arsenatis]|uniref:tRNA threonylcarbamoyladenosine biosynthesis protein TsaE n=1 Tax=Flavobacterium arsenatis TaxID=1484332 RepID=A0ABU1TR73_9FLAO|nr:tRNA (adenosine(37)-N6)-threonylcarbamoyltransferase complex ATPase subunit type 1 TsaE [Flavobacterium arsenatis]MDR6968078.1 tRNA threonylcarbamoyladenosine biosynthesis protein TsaE [Flavobacterium arsenatis]